MDVITAESSKLPANVVNTRQRRQEVLGKSDKKKGRRTLYKELVVFCQGIRIKKVYIFSLLMITKSITALNIEDYEKS